MACLPLLYRDLGQPEGRGLRDALRLAQQRLRDVGLYEGEIDAIFGKNTQQAVRDFQKRHGLEDDGIIGPNTWGALLDDSGDELTPKDLAEITRRPLRAVEAFVKPLRETMARYDIDTPLRKAHFLAQVLHESARLKYTEEIWGPTEQQKTYQGRMGNDEPGDGYRFRGRGIIQLTGKNNYEAYHEALLEREEPRQILQNPDLVAGLPLAVDAAGWYWSRHDLNRLADRDDVRAVTRAINGGYNGLSDRKRLLTAAKRRFAGFS